MFTETATSSIGVKNADDFSPKGAIVSARRRVTVRVATKFGKARTLAGTGATAQRKLLGQRVGITRAACISLRVPTWSPAPTRWNWWTRRCMERQAGLPSPLLSHPSGFASPALWAWCGAERSWRYPWCAELEVALLSPSFCLPPGCAPSRCTDLEGSGAVLAERTMSGAGGSALASFLSSLWLLPPRPFGPGAERSGRYRHLPFFHTGVAARPGWRCWTPALGHRSSSPPRRLVLFRVRGGAELGVFFAPSFLPSTSLFRHTLIAVFTSTPLHLLRNSFHSFLSCAFFLCSAHALALALFNFSLHLASSLWRPHLPCRALLIHIK